MSALITMLLQTLYYCIYCFESLKQLDSAGQTLPSILKLPIWLAYTFVIVAVIFQSVSCLILGRLLAFHIWLRHKGLTTYEYIMKSKVSPITIQPQLVANENVQTVQQSIKTEELPKSDRMIPERRQSKEKYQLVVKGKSLESNSARETTFKQPIGFQAPVETDHNILMTMSNAPLNPLSGNCSLLPGDSPFKDKYQNPDHTQSGMKCPDLAIDTPSLSAGDEERMHDPTPYTPRRSQHLLQHPHHQRGGSQTEDSPPPDRRPLQQRRTQDLT